MTKTQPRGWWCCGQSSRSGAQAKAVRLQACVSDNRGDRFDEIVYDDSFGQAISLFGFGFRSCPGSNQNRFTHTRVPTALHIAHFVAHHVTPGQINAEFPPRIEKKLRRWLASM